MIGPSGNAGVVFVPQFALFVGRIINRDERRSRKEQKQFFASSSFSVSFIILAASFLRPLTRLSTERKRYPGTVARSFPSFSPGFTKRTAVQTVSLYFLRCKFVFPSWWICLGGQAIEYTRWKFLNWFIVPSLKHFVCCRENSWITGRETFRLGTKIYSGGTASGWRNINCKLI